MQFTYGDLNMLSRFCLWPSPLPTPGVLVPLTGATEGLGTTSIGVGLPVGGPILGGGGKVLGDFAMVFNMLMRASWWLPPIAADPEPANGWYAA